MDEAKSGRRALSPRPSLVADAVQKATKFYVRRTIFQHLTTQELHVWLTFKGNSYRCGEDDCIYVTLELSLLSDIVQLRGAWRCASFALRVACVTMACYYTREVAFREACLVTPRLFRATLGPEFTIEH